MKMRRNKLIRLFALLLAAVLLLGGCTASAAGKNRKNRNTAAPTATPLPEATVTPGPMDKAQELVDYLAEYGELPENFIRKKEAEARGWKTIYRYVSDIGPGITIGGDYFGNYEEKLPRVKGRKYYEADCFYEGGPRNEYRIIFSDDGHYWYTEDHYETFTELFPTKEEDTE